MSTEDHKCAVRAFFDATTRRDRDALAALFADDVVWQIPRSAPAPFGGRHQGHDKVLELFLQGAAGLFVPGTHTIEEKLLLAVKAVGEEDGLTLVLTRDLVAWSNGTIDVTDRIITRFDQMFPANETSAAP